jgi:hypothetical protein
MTIEAIARNHRKKCNRIWALHIWARSMIKEVYEKYKAKKVIQFLNWSR